MKARVVATRVVGLAAFIGLAVESLAATEIHVYELIELYSEQNDVAIVVSPGLELTAELDTTTLDDLDRSTFAAILKCLGLALDERGDGFLVIKRERQDRDGSDSLL